MNRGVFIVIEGVDGAGKSEQVKQLAERLNAAGRRVIITREPSGGPVGVSIRKVLKGSARLYWRAMALMFIADRADHLAREVEPALGRGAIVVCDRYDLSGLCYQSASAPDGEGEATIAWLLAAGAVFRRPDLTVLLELPVEAAASRRQARGGAPELYERDDFLVKVAAAYGCAERMFPGDNIIRVDGAGSPDEVAARVYAAVAPLIAGRPA